MTIGIDASRANHTQKTGVEWYAYFVIEELKKILPAEVQVILYSDVPLHGDLAKLPQNWSAKVLSWPPKRLWTQLRMSFEMLFHAPDILFIPAHVFPILHPKKTIMTVHDIAGIKFPASYNWFERWYSTWTAKYAVNKLWKVIVPSQFTKDELLTYFPKAKKQNITVIHNGYDEKFLVPVSNQQKQEVLKKYNINKSYLLTIGRLEEKKNTWRIIKAFEEIKKNATYEQLQLVLVGQPGFGYEKVEQTLNQSPVKGDIIHPGWVNKDDLPALMQGAEVFVFPSLYEGFGIPVLEAFASGTPVVVSQGSCLEEVGQEGTVVVDSQSEISIAEGILSFLASSDLKIAKITAGKVRLQDFSWQKCAQDIAKVLLKNQ